MFNSALEVAKFHGAAIRTVSGIRGQIKKVAKEHPGAFRATFEDKILLSGSLRKKKHDENLDEIESILDIIFLRAWFPVQVPKFYTPVTNILMPIDEKDQWQGLRFVSFLFEQSENEISSSFDQTFS